MDDTQHAILGESVEVLTDLGVKGPAHERAVDFPGVQFYLRSCSRLTAKTECRARSGNVEKEDYALYVSSTMIRY